MIPVPIAWYAFLRMNMSDTSIVLQKMRESTKEFIWLGPLAMAMQSFNERPDLAFTRTEFSTILSFVLAEWSFLTPKIELRRG